MHATIFALETEVPERSIDQEGFIERTGEFLNLSDSEKHLLKRIALNQSIYKRHTVLEDFFEEEGFYGSKGGMGFPTTKARSHLYKKKAPLLAERVCRKVLEKWGGDLKNITHIISVSCTGLMAPGIEFLLIEKLGLSPTVERLGINFMGCFGAFKGLAVAKALSFQNPHHRVLLVCTELCSLHFNKELSKEAIVGNSLFADGAAAAIVGTTPRPFEKPLLELHKQASKALSKTEDLMTWNVGDFGYEMRLSVAVPSYLEACIAPFATHILGEEISFTECAFAVHPGGKAILKSIEKACCIERELMSSSWSILKNFGNMSSPTFLFVLQEILKTKREKEWILGLGFGPGLSIEGMLLKRIDREGAG